MKSQLRSDRGSKATRGRPRKAPAQNSTTGDSQIADNPKSTNDEPQTPTLVVTPSPHPLPSDAQISIPVTVASIATAPVAQSKAPVVSATKSKPSSWADVVAAEAEMAKTRNETIKVRQNPDFILKLNESMVSAEKVEFTDEELLEGSEDWKLTLIGCVVGTEVSWANMEKFVRAKWKGMQIPKIVKRNGVFLFQFHAQEDLTKIYESFTFFIFDHPLLLKQYELGMPIGRHIFDLSSVWIRLPGLRLDLWQPKLLSKLISPFGAPLMADQATIHKTRLDYARILVQLHDPQNLQQSISIKTPDSIEMQQVIYEWDPSPCPKCDKWGHKSDECDPNHSTKLKDSRLKNKAAHKPELAVQTTTKEDHRQQLNHPTAQAQQAVQQQHKAKANHSDKVTQHQQHEKEQIKDKDQTQQQDGSHTLQQQSELLKDRGKRPITQSSTSTPNNAVKDVGSPNRFTQLQILKGTTLEEADITLIPY